MRRRYLRFFCEFLLWFDHKYHANILCQCILAVLPGDQGMKRITEGREMRLILYCKNAVGNSLTFLQIFHFILLSTPPYYKIFEKTKTQTSKYNLNFIFLNNLE